MLSNILLERFMFYLFNYRVEKQGVTIRTIKMDELIGSLQVFEMAINGRIEKKTKSIVFVSNTKEDDDQCEKDTEESLSDAIALVGRNFNKAFKRLDIRWRTNVKDKIPDNFKSIGSQCKSKDEDKPNKDKGIQCHECEGFCHIKVEYPTFFEEIEKGNVNHLV